MEIPTLHVLLIEDDPAYALLIREMLADAKIAQFDVECVDRLASGTQRLAQGGIDVVLLDLKLPDSHGLDTFREAQRQAPTVPIIVLTGFEDETLALQSIQQGAQDYLVKGHIDVRILDRSLRYAIERKRAEGLLRESEQRFRLIHDLAPIGITSVGADGRLLHVNSALQKMLGYSEAELQRLTFMELTHHDDLEKCLDAFGKLVDGRYDHIFLETRARRKDGALLWCQTAAKAVRDLQGGFVHTVAMVYDISERKLLEKKLAELTIREQRRIGQDVHDGLGQELTGLGHMAKTLKHQLQSRALPEADTAAELADGIQRTRMQVRSIIKNLIPVEIDTEGLLSALRDLTLNTEQRSGIHCRFACDRPVPLHDANVATHLFRIAQEAVNNAVKHGQPKNIVVTLYSDEKLIVLSVRDDGVGLKSQTSSSSGMGLDIMRHRAAVIGACLDIRRVKQGGSVVSCFLTQEAYRDQEHRQID